ncbi:MAG: pirin family protein, partial [Acidimicrobiia bacterium]
PRRGRRTVGAWCFADHMGPAPVTEERGLDIGPHPHIGLQTVTWLFAGDVLHRDSLGSEQVIRPGQLNLMTAGRGVSHSEEATGAYRGELHGIQLWVAQPSETRDGEPAFEHHAELPRVELRAAVATIMVGDLGGLRSPARRDTDHIGVDLDLRPGDTTMPLRATSEHALVVATGSITVDGAVIETGRLAYLGAGRDELRVTASAPARAVLLGGTPFPETLVMWWNYVARTREEIGAAHEDWSSDSDRYGRVASPLARMDVGPPPWSVPG